MGLDEDENEVFMLVNADEDDEGGASDDEFGDDDDDDDEDEEEDFDLSNSHNRLYQCPFTNSDTCLAVAASVEMPPSVDASSCGAGDNERKGSSKMGNGGGRPQSTEGVCYSFRRHSDLPVGGEPTAPNMYRPRGATTSPKLPSQLIPVSLNDEETTDRTVDDSSENLPDLILRCLLRGEANSLN